MKTEQFEQVNSFIDEKTLLTTQYNQKKQPGEIHIAFKIAIFTILFLTIWGIGKIQPIQRGSTSQFYNSLQKIKTWVDYQLSYQNIQEKQLQTFLLQSNQGVRQRQNGTVKIIDMLKKDHQGQGIQRVLYDEDTQHKRLKFMQERREFLSDKTQFESLSLIQYNILLNNDDAKLKHKAELTEYQRLNAKYHLNKVKYELPICAVLTGYNNNADFRIELNLNSIFSQNYSNFFVALVNDASDDGSDEVYRKYFAFHNLSSERFVYIENKVRKTALENIYDLIMNHCSEDSIVFNIDADDELIGTNVFKVFNAEYQRTNGGVLYSSMYRYIQGVFLGFNQTSQYTQEQKQQTLYRTAKRRYLQLRTFRADLFRKINITDLKDESGKFYKVTYDLIIMHPLMELSCTHVHWVQESFYLYNIGTGLNDFQTNRKEQLRVAQIARKKPKYSCDPLYIDNNNTSKNSLIIDKKPQQIQQTKQKRMKKTNQKKSQQDHNYSFFKKRKNYFSS